MQRITLVPETTFDVHDISFFIHQVFQQNGFIDKVEYAPVHWGVKRRISSIRFNVERDYFSGLGSFFVFGCHF
jgi:hypothetical protein